MSLSKPRKPSHHQEGVSLPWMSQTLPAARGSPQLALRTLRPTARLTGPSLSLLPAWDSTSLVLSSLRRPFTSRL
uniref:IDP1438 n=1 Tax=Arundo donax TaxID=35708 RepID=A0A0A9H685_ARUDO